MRTLRQLRCVFHCCTVSISVPRKPPTPKTPAPLQGRALLFTIPTAIQLMWHAQDVEATVAAALWVPTTPAQAAVEATGAGAAADGSPKDPPMDVECGKHDLENGGSAAENGTAAVAANGVASGGAAVGGGAPTAAAQPALSVPARMSAATTLAKRNRLGPYVKNAVTLLALASSLASWATFAKGIAEAVSNLPAALSSRAAFSQGAHASECSACADVMWGCCCKCRICVQFQLPPRHVQPCFRLPATHPHHAPCDAAAVRRPHNQFAFKFWLGLSLSMMGMIIFTWQVGAQPGRFIFQSSSSILS